MLLLLVMYLYPIKNVTIQNIQTNGFFFAPPACYFDSFKRLLLLFFQGQKQLK